MADETTTYDPSDPLAHAGLVIDIAKKYRNLGLDPDDLFQEGQLGLLHACKNFDAAKGYEFSTYAYHCISGFMLKAINEMRFLVRVPWEHRQKTDGQLHRRASRLDQLTINTHRQGQWRQKSKDEHADHLPDSDRLLNALLILPERERAAIEMRFGIDRDTPMLMREIGDALGVTGERAKQIVNRGIRRLRIEFKVDVPDQDEQQVA